MENNENCVTQLKLHPSLSSSMAVCFIESSSILFNLLRWWRLAEFDLFDFFLRLSKHLCLTTLSSQSVNTKMGRKETKNEPNVASCQAAGTCAYWPCVLLFLLQGNRSIAIKSAG